MAISRRLLSTSTGGLPITLSASSVTVVHTTGISASIFDAAYIYASNSSTSNTEIRLYFGIGASLGSNDAFFSIPALTTIQICNGQILSGDNSSAKSISVYTISSSIRIFGYINRIS